MNEDELGDELSELEEMRGEEISELKARIAEAERPRSDEEAWYALVVDKWGVQPCDFTDTMGQRVYQIREGQPQTPKVGGYPAFAISFVFDASGKFVRMDIFE